MGINVFVLNTSESYDDIKHVIAKLADAPLEEAFTEELLSRAYDSDIAVSRNPLNNNLEITTKVNTKDKAKESALLRKICCV